MLKQAYKGVPWIEFENIVKKKYLGLNLKTGLKRTISDSILNPPKKDRLGLNL